MEYFIKDFLGVTHVLSCKASNTVLDVKTEVAEKLNLNVNTFYLSFNDEIPCESLIISNLPSDVSTFYVNLELLGGGKKRKKKTYATPKKNKHKKRKVKLAVLNFYKIQDGTNKITRLRKECPSETCGTGVFMANHKNRNYCGRCGSTYFMKTYKEGLNAN